MSTNEIDVNAVNARAREKQTPMTNQAIGQAGGGLESVGRAGVPDPLRQEACSCHAQFPCETHKNNL